jgi:chromosome partitioning protein
LDPDPPPRGGHVVSVVNQKGGVGKTTTSVNLAAALALRGHRVLVVDMDPQGNATTGTGVDRSRVTDSTYELLIGEADLPKVTHATAVDNLFTVPASADLAGAEVELVSEYGRERKLADALASQTGQYALTIVDCPPSLGLLTVNALVAAQSLIVPVQCEYYALEGLGALVNNAERIRRAVNPHLRVAGLLLTMYDARTKLSSQVADEIRSHFGDLVFSTVVPRSVRLSEAPSFGEPVLTLDPGSRGAISYKLLATEIEQRYGLVLEPSAAFAPPSPGPSGRGYGTVSAAPPALERAWPRRTPWGGTG